ncbi:transcriptional regulator [Roseburia sp. AM59-24XD]|jgi:putative transcriptional regulator|nr:transcriptional regulator [Roseburia sp. AM59-24XD]
MISTYDQYGGHYMVTNNISEIRKEKHLSQDDLAVALGVCRKSIFNIEHNNVIPNIDTCLRLAKYLDMTVEDLFEIQDA